MDENQETVQVEDGAAAPLASDSENVAVEPAPVEAAPVYDGSADESHLHP